MNVVLMLLIVSTAANIFLVIKYLSAKLAYSAIVYYCVEKEYEIDTEGVNKAIVKIGTHYANIVRRFLGLKEI